MLRPVMSAGVVLGLTVLGCTSHTDEPAPKPDAAAEPQTPERKLEPATSTESPSGPSPRRVSTPLQHKPFVGALGELTGDAQVDLLALCHGNGDGPGSAALVVLSGARDGSFVEADPVFVEGTGLALGDLDGDGDLDALILDASGKPAYRVARNDGAGVFTLGSKQRIPGTYGGELRGASIIDLDRDGDLDAIVPLWDEVRVLLGDGDGGFKPGAALEVGRDPFATGLAYLDDDGQLDLVVTSGAAPASDPDTYESAGASVWIYRGGTRGFADPVRVEVFGAKQLAFAELDRDARIEIVVSGDGGLTIIRDALGVPQIERTVVANDGPLLIADLLGSPEAELITTSYIQGQVHLLDNYPKLDKTSIEAGDYVVGMFVADVAHDDDRYDLVLLNAGPPPHPAMASVPSVEVVFFDA